MNPGVFSVQRPRIVLSLIFIVIVGGIFAYTDLGRLEDPEFTIKQAVIVTPYPGASPEDVVKEVTNLIETRVSRWGRWTASNRSPYAGARSSWFISRTNIIRTASRRCGTSFAAKSMMCSLDCRLQCAAHRRLSMISAMYTAFFLHLPVRFHATRASPLHRCRTTRVATGS